MDNVQRNVSRLQWNLFIYYNSATPQVFLFRLHSYFSTANRKYMNFHIVQARLNGDWITGVCFPSSLMHFHFPNMQLTPYLQCLGWSKSSRPSSSSSISHWLFLFPYLYRHVDSPCCWNICCFCVPVTADVFMLMSGSRMISEPGLLIDCLIPSPSWFSVKLFHFSISTMLAKNIKIRNAFLLSRMGTRF